MSGAPGNANGHKKMPSSRPSGNRVALQGPRGRSEAGLANDSRGPLGFPSLVDRDYRVAVSAERWKLGIMFLMPLSR